jgi:hypothetical protein
MKHFIARTFERLGYKLLPTRGRYAEDGLYAMHDAPFLRDPAFQAAYVRGVEAGQGVDPHFAWRVHIALWAASASLRVPGDFVECGVNAGFLSSAILERLDWNRRGRKFYLVDTFSGPPCEQFSPAEVKRGRLAIARRNIEAGAYVTDLERVRANFAAWPSAVVVQGVVPEVLAGLPVSEVAFLHIDMNCAYPERAALEFFWPRLSPGAIVLLDDYAYYGHEEQGIRMRETCRNFGVEILALPTGQGLILRQEPPG